MVYCGIFLIAISASIAICHKIRKKTVSKKNFPILGSMLLLGLVLYIWSFAYISSAEEACTILVGSFFVCFGVFLLIMIIPSIKAINKCTEPISGRYIKKEHVYSKAFLETYIPIFEYSRDCKLFIAKSRQGFASNYIDKNFSKNKKYEIYIAPDVPDSCIVQKGIQAKHVLTIISASFIFLFGLFIMLIAK